MITFKDTPLCNYPDVWMFHYVRPKDDAELPYLNQFSRDEFCRSLDLFQNRYEVLSPGEFIEYLEGNTFPENSCLLTFDDGLSDHYRWVYPELKARGLTGLFFIISGPYEDNKVTAVHKTHMLYGRLGYPEFIRRFHKAAKSKISEFDDQLLADDAAKDAYPFDTPEVAGFKYAINYLMSPLLRDELVDMLFSEEFDEMLFLRKLYLSRDEILEMRKGGMVFGIHSHRHRPYASLTRSELESDLKQSIRFYCELFNEDPKFLSYPFGDATAVTDSVVRQVANHGIRAAFMAMETTNSGPHYLSRLDCNVIRQIFQKERSKNHV